MKDMAIQMDKNKVNEILSITLGSISFLAIIGLLVQSKFETNEILSSIINFTQVAIPVLVLLVTTTLNKETKSFLQIGKESLIHLQAKFPEMLLGPKYNREDYDPEKGNGVEYLFIKNGNSKSKLKAKFIPVQPLEEGVLTIYIQKATLVYGLNYESDDATPEAIQKIQAEVKRAIIEKVESQFKNKYEVLDHKKSDAAVIIDFNEQAMTKKSFSKAIYECSETALLKILEYQLNK
jgi:hypothetical protein